MNNANQYCLLGKNSTFWRNFSSKLLSTSEHHILFLYCIIMVRILFECISYYFLCQNLCEFYFVILFICQFSFQLATKRICHLYQWHYNECACDIAYNMYIQYMYILLCMATAYLYPKFTLCSKYELNEVNEIQQSNDIISNVLCV